MDESKLNINIQKTANGWLVEFTKWDETKQYVYSRTNPALRMVRAVMREDFDPFEGVSSPEEIDYET